ncbi:MAG: hypothetical protein NTZ34_03055 [Chloroflexi bacterium]|nr:hypothetical protein [Chloroflexota bacterium]
MEIDTQHKEKIRRDIEYTKKILLPSWNLDEWEKRVWESISLLESSQGNGDNALSHLIERKSVPGALFQKA